MKTILESLAQGWIYAVLLIVVMIGMIEFLKWINRLDSNSGNKGSVVDEKTGHRRYKRLVEKRTVGITNTYTEVPLIFNRLGEAKGELIGTAFAYIEDRAIMCSMSVEDDIIDISGFYPAICGQVIKMNEFGEIELFELKYIQISIIPNEDSSIRAI